MYKKELLGLTKTMREDLETLRFDMERAAKVGDLDLAARQEGSASCESLESSR